MAITIMSASTSVLLIRRSSDGRKEQGEIEMKIVLALALLAGSLHAQDLPSKPQPQTMVRVQLTYPSDDYKKHWVELPVPHRTADAAWIGWNSAGIAACGVDLGLALTHLNQEGNPIVKAAPGVAVGLCALSVGLAGVYSWKNKREEDAVRAAGIPHRGFKWWAFDLAVIAPHAAGIAISLATLAHR